MCERLTKGEIAFRKAYLGAILDRVEVHAGVIRIIGRKDVLEQVIAANGSQSCSQMAPRTEYNCEPLCY